VQRDLRASSLFRSAAVDRRRGSEDRRVQSKAASIVSSLGPACSCATRFLKQSRVILYTDETIANGGRPLPALKTERLLKSLIRQREDTLANSRSSRN
jgi:hypothetical protein